VGEEREKCVKIKVRRKRGWKVEGGWYWKKKRINDMMNEDVVKKRGWGKKEGREEGKERERRVWAGEIGLLKFFAFVCHHSLQGGR
jgi:hypothetical protein